MLGIAPPGSLGSLSALSEAMRASSPEQPETAMMGTRDATTQTEVVRVPIARVTTVRLRPRGRMFSSKGVSPQLWFEVCFFA